MSIYDHPSKLTFAELLDAIKQDAGPSYAETAQSNAWEAACDLEILSEEITPDTAERRAIIENCMAFATELRARVERGEAA
jgi:hypothetical protein